MSHTPLALVASCAICLAVSAPAPGALPATGGADSSAIAFASHRDGNWEIYVAGGDGARQTRLTTRDRHDRFPLWSPDGSRIAFGSQAGTGEWDWELWVMDADGASPRRLCSGLVAKSGREWSPDGTRIALTASVSGDVEIIVVHVADGRITRLTRTRGDDHDPSWSRTASGSPSRRCATATGRSM